MRRLLAVLLMATASLFALALPANADECTTYTDDSGNVRVDCGADDTNPGGGGGGGNGGVGSEKCMFGSEEIACEGPGGDKWNAEKMCYVGDPLAPQPPAPPGKDPESGQWRFCFSISSAQDNGVSAWFDNAEVLIDPVVLARRAITAMNLDPITLGTAPESGQNSMGLIGLPVWMWAKDPAANTWGPITRSASQGPVTVTATGKVKNSVWSMGNGETVTCTDSGRSYTAADGKNSSPSCGYRYDKMSPLEGYKVTATTHWVIEWTGGGQSGVIEMNLTSAPTTIRVGEMQVLGQN